MNANAYDAAFARLKKSKFRSRFHLSEADRKYIIDKWLETIRSHCEDFIRTRLAPASPPNDGKQTPMRGHPVFKEPNTPAPAVRHPLALSLVVSPWVATILKGRLRRDCLAK